MARMNNPVEKDKYYVVDERGSIAYHTFPITVQEGVGLECREDKNRWASKRLVNR